jgi:hypothetical protein
MRKALTVLAAAAIIAASAVPTAADARRGARGTAEGSGAAAGAPYRYFGGSYNSGLPAPVYFDYYGFNPIYYDDYAAPQVSDDCWRYRYGYRYRVC